MNKQSFKPEKPIIEQFDAAIVIGLGVTGYSVVRYLVARGLEVIVVDSRDNPPLLDQLQTHYPQVKYKLGSLDHKDYQDIGLFVVSPGLSLKEPFIQTAKNAGVHVVGDIELFIQENTKPLIAITGSNGKSTVTTLVGEMCKQGGFNAHVAGNIGLPALDVLTDHDDYDVAVLELSSFQLETTSHIPADVSTILNISTDHMDRYDSMGDYVLAKARIFRGAQQVVLPKHDETLQQITNISNVLNFSMDEPANDNDFGVKRESNFRWLKKGEQRLIKLRDIPLTGLHNVQNVLAAFALVDFLEIPTPQKVDAVKGFTGLPHRMQTVLVTDDITWVNDSKATNIGATSTALKNIENDVIWIAGGQGKGADFNQLKSVISEKIQLLILFGEDADQIEAALDGMLEIVRVKTMQQAVNTAGERADGTSIVLFSPACASFDMYASFEQRGDDFAAQVNQWAKRGAA